MTATTTLTLNALREGDVFVKWSGEICIARKKSFMGVEVEFDDGRIERIAAGSEVAKVVGHAVAVAVAIPVSLPSGKPDKIQKKKNIAVSARVKINEKIIERSTGNGKKSRYKSKSKRRQYQTERRESHQTKRDE